MIQEKSGLGSVDLRYSSHLNICDIVISYNLERVYNTMLLLRMWME